MIDGMHVMFYSSAAEELRAFLRDKLGFTWDDPSGEWPIFRAPPGEIGCHPTEHADSPAGTHEISFTCDDLERTMAELRARGVELSDEVVETDWGVVTHLKMPGGVTAQLYQPKYELRFEEAGEGGTHD